MIGHGTYTYVRTYIVQARYGRIAQIDRWIDRQISSRDSGGKRKIRPGLNGKRKHVDATQASTIGFCLLFFYSLVAKFVPGEENRYDPSSRIAAPSVTTSTHKRLDKTETCALEP